MSTLLATIKDYRSRLLLNEKEATRILEAAHAQTLATLQPTLDRLYQQMADALANGEQLPVSWLYEANRLEIIKQLITGQIDQFGALSLMTTGRLQQSGLQLGMDAALAMLRSTVPAGVAWTFGVPSQKAIHNMIGATQAGSPLTDLFQGFGAEAAQLASRALITGVTLGYHPRRIAPMVEEALGVSRNRALVISRQEMLRCYKNAATETYRENDDVVDQWRWTCAKQPRTCIACLMMDGTLHDLSEDLESHIQCRCVPSPVTKPWEAILGPLGIDTRNLPDTRLNIESGADWFTRQGESVQRQVLGDAKYKAWQDGQFQLRDLVGYTHDPDWGTSVKVKPLKDLVGAS